MILELRSRSQRSRRARRRDCARAEALPSAFFYTDGEQTPNSLTHVRPLSALYAGHLTIVSCAPPAGRGGGLDGHTSHCHLGTPTRRVRAMAGHVGVSFAQPLLFLLAFARIGALMAEDGAGDQARGVAYSRSVPPAVIARVHGHRTVESTWPVISASSGAGSTRYAGVSVTSTISSGQVLWIASAR